MAGSALSDAACISRSSASAADAAAPAATTPAGAVCIRVNSMPSAIYIHIYICIYTYIYIHSGVFMDFSVWFISTGESGGLGGDDTCVYALH